MTERSRADDCFDAITKLYDRAAHPSHGYRAKHLVVKVDGRRIEIQVRTEMQNLWALVSEKIADIYGQQIKYGQGDIEVVQMLMRAADAAADAERRGLPAHQIESLKGTSINSGKSLTTNAA